MNEKDLYYIDNNIKFRNVKLIDGIYTKVETAAIVGKCRYKLHPGYLNTSYLNSHKCIEKECPYLERFEEYPFWAKYYKRLERKEKQKRITKEIKERKKAERINEEKNRELLKNEIQKLADTLLLPILVTSSAYTNDKKQIIVNYVSDKRYNDYTTYLNFAHEIRQKYNCFCKLNHIKNVDGYYATFDDCRKGA